VDPANSLQNVHAIHNAVAESNQQNFYHQPPARTLMEVIERIQKQLADHTVILYMKGSPSFPQCGFSAKAVQILENCGVDYAYINIFEDPELRENLKIYSQWPTFPQLYVRGELVGGSDIMIELFQQGELQKILSGESA
jgi:monothiol glutaredoxin